MSDNVFATPFVYEILDPLEIDGAQHHHATVCTVDDLGEARQFEYADAPLSDHPALYARIEVSALSAP